MPALRSTTMADADALRSAGSRAIGSARQGRLRRALLVGEIAISALLGLLDGPNRPLVEA
jgi:hypothetical protein